MGGTLKAMSTVYQQWLKQTVPNEVVVSVHVVYRVAAWLS